MPRPNKPWLRKDTGVWYATMGGKRVELARGKKNKKAAEDKFHELMAGRHRPADCDNARVADIVEEFLTYSKRRYATDTHRNYRFYGQSFAEGCGYLPVAKLRPFHITRWVDAKPWNETSEYNARRIAFRCMSWAVEEGLLSSNPLKGMKRPRPNTKKRALKDEEFRAILAASRGPFRHFIWTLRQTGARPAELRHLTWDHVQGERLVIPEHKTGKKVRKPRVIYLTPPVQRLIARLRKDSTSDHVFLNTRGNPWTTNAIRLQIARIREKQELSKDVCAYLVRHTYGTRAVMNGLNSSEVAELMGHSSTEMVDRVYVHLADQVSHMSQAACRATRAS